MIEVDFVMEDIAHLDYHSHYSTKEVVLVLLPSMDILVVAVIHITTVGAYPNRITRVEATIRTITVEAYPSRITRVGATNRTIMEVVIAHTTVVVEAPCLNSHTEEVAAVAAVTSLVVRIGQVDRADPMVVVRYNPYIKHLKGHYSGYCLLHSST